MTVGSGGGRYLQLGVLVSVLGAQGTLCSATCPSVKAKAKYNFNPNFQYQIFNFISPY